MQSNIYSLFAVPFIQVQHPDCEQLNQNLRDVILAREALGSRYRNPSPAMGIHESLFESSFDFFASTDPCVEKLRTFCFSWLMRSIAELSGLSQTDLKQLNLRSQTWFHVSRSGAFFELHNHPMASWSGVYCVSPGEQGAPNNGAISFLNPMGASNMFLDKVNSQTKLPFSGRNFLLRPAAGELILFPSYLFHQVLPYLGESERITVAFNCWFD